MAKQPDAPATKPEAPKPEVPATVDVQIESVPASEKPVVPAPNAAPAKPKTTSVINGNKIEEN